VYDVTKKHGVGECGLKERKALEKSQLLRRYLPGPNSTSPGSRSPCTCRCGSRGSILFINSINPEKW